MHAGICRLELRYPDEAAIYEPELAFELAGKDFAGATALIVRYQKTFPKVALFVVRAQAQVEAGRGSAKDGLAVFDRSFQPLWPAELVKGYYDLLESGHLTLKTRDELRAKLASRPDGGLDALIDAAKLFYIYQQQGQLEAAKAVLADYRTHKDGRAEAWSADELFTFARLLEQIQDFPEAARYYYAMAADKRLPMRNRKGWPDWPVCPQNPKTPKPQNPMNVKCNLHLIKCKIIIKNTGLIKMDEDDSKFNFAEDYEDNKRMQIPSTNFHVNMSFDSRDASPKINLNNLNDLGKSRTT